MMNLNDVYETYLKDGQNVTGKKVWLTDNWSGSLSRSKYFYLSPLDFLETDKYYLFDRRKAYMKTNLISSIVTPFVFVGFVFILWWSAWGKAPQSFFLVIVAFFLGLSPYLPNKIINQGLVNIVILKKEWIKETITEGENTILKGKIPKEENYSFVYLLNKEEQKKLSFLDKLFSGLYFKKGNFQDVDFQFSYRDA